MSRWKSTGNYNASQQLKRGIFLAEIFLDRNLNDYTLLIAIDCEDGIRDYLDLVDGIYSELEAKELGERVLKELSRLYSGVPEDLLVEGYSSGLLRPPIATVTRRLLGRDRFLDV